MHNFSWFLGQPIHDPSKLTDDEKANNTAAENALKSILDEKHIETFNNAKDKLKESLKKKSGKVMELIIGNQIFI